MPEAEGELTSGGFGDRYFEEFERRLRAKKLMLIFSED